MRYGFDPNRILATPRKHSAIIRAALEIVEDIAFRRIPDPSGDNASFLSFFLPAEELTRKAHKALLENGLGGHFYWYDNHWHYVKQWAQLNKGYLPLPLKPRAYSHHYQDGL